MKSKYSGERNFKPIHSMMPTDDYRKNFCFQKKPSTCHACKEPVEGHSVTRIGDGGEVQTFHPHCYDKAADA